MKNNLIPEVFDPSTGEFIKSVNYFSNLTDIRRDEIHSKRRELILAKRKGEKLWVCAMCQNPVSIAGGHGDKKRRHHFRHFVFAEKCPYQTKGLTAETIRKIKYNGAKESQLHKDMKASIAESLDEDLLVSGSVLIEKTFFHKDGGREWRRPDVACVRDDEKLVFEIQISTDFVDVIVAREEFYRSQGVFIFWIFRENNPNLFTARDIYVGNQKNVFVFNDRVRQISQATYQLTLECHYKKPTLKDFEIVDGWQVIDVTLNDLVFDKDKMQTYYFHYDEEYEKLKNIKLSEEFKHYWCNLRGDLDSDERIFYDEKFEEKFTELLGVPERCLRSPAAKMIDAFYSFKNGISLRTNQNLYALVDVLLEHRKQFTYITLWAITLFGYHSEFKGRPSFNKKVVLYKDEKETNSDYRHDQRYDALFLFLFPELRAKLSDQKLC